MSEEVRTIKQLISDAGGAEAIAEAANNRGHKLTKWAIYKWEANGIPEKYWEVLTSLTQATPNEIYAANEPTRAQAA